jgi:hypothetical protein
MITTASAPQAFPGPAAAVTLTATAPARMAGHKLVTTAAGPRGAGVLAECSCGENYGGPWLARHADRLRATHRQHLLAAKVAQRDVRANASNAAGVYVETAEYFSFMRRIAKGAAKRAGDMDAESLAELSGLIDDLRAFETEAALKLNASGVSWTEIGDAQGICRQNAHKKYARSSGRSASRKGTIAKGTNTKAAQ